MINIYSDSDNAIINQLELDFLLNQLEDEDRKILVLWLEGHTRGEIATILKKSYPKHIKITSKTITMRLESILQQLKCVILGKKSL